MYETHGLALTMTLTMSGFDTMVGLLTLAWQLWTSLGITCIHILASWISLSFPSVNLLHHTVWYYTITYYTIPYIQYLTVMYWSWTVLERGIWHEILWSGGARHRWSGRILDGTWAPLPARKSCGSTLLSTAACWTTRWIQLSTSLHCWKQTAHIPQHTSLIFVFVSS